MQSFEAKPLAVVLASGGMDSCVTLAIAHQDYELAMLHVAYGQRTEARELKAFNALADFYHAKCRMIGRLEHLAKIGGSSLTDANIPVERADLERKGIPSSYVPFRNAHFLSIAVSWGEVLDAQKIFVGAVAEDSSGYPDCRPEYYEAFNRVIAAGTKPETRLEIVTPVIHLRKSEIVRRSEEHTSELQSLAYLVCRLLLEKKKNQNESHLASGQYQKPVARVAFVNLE